jgi:hypothetical protein
MRSPELVTRADLYAVKDMVDGPCTCPVSVQATRSELTLAQFKRVACKACQARAAVGWVGELSEDA